MGIDPSIWMPALSGILGAAIGAVSAFFPSYLLERSRARREADNLRKALVTEIEALILIAQSRRYLDGLNQAERYLRSMPKGCAFPFIVNVPEHYARVFSANCQRIGEIDSPDAVQILSFHQLIDSVVQDVKPGGSLAIGTDANSFAEASELLSRALVIGKDLVSRNQLSR